MRSLVDEAPNRTVNFAAAFVIWRQSSEAPFVCGVPFDHETVTPQAGETLTVPPPVLRRVPTIAPPD
jgi:hypothetical protein